MIIRDKPVERKRVNVDQVVKFLNHAFSKARSTARRTVDVKSFEVEFSYLIDEIQRGPIYISPKKISEANELIELLATAE